MEKFQFTPITQPTKVEGQVGIDANGKAIEVGAIVKVKGSSILRRVSAYQTSPNLICTQRVDGKNIGSNNLAADNIEVMEVA